MDNEPQKQIAMSRDTGRKPLRVCFVAINAYSAIDPQATGAIGGIETRAWMFARALAARDDCQVKFVVRYSRPLRQSEFENVQLVPILDRWYRLRESVSTRIERAPRFPYLKLKSWSFSLLWQLPFLAGLRLFRKRSAQLDQPDPTLSAVDADVICTFGVQSHAALTIRTAHARNKPVLLVLGSDSDLDENYTEHSTYLNPYTDRGDLCWRILQSADAIVCQTPWQLEALKSRFGRDATMIENPIDIDEWQSRQELPIPEELTGGLKRYVLWVGRAEAIHKRPQLCVNLARLCPEVPFLMILNPRDDALEEQLRREAPANVTFVRQVPFPHMPALFHRAAALVNTSSLEGFPNTFLQAALSRVPVGALNVGESFLQTTGGGVYCGGQLDKLAEFVKQAWTDPASWQLRVATAREYVITHHGLPAQADRFVQALRVTQFSQPSSGRL